MEIELEGAEAPPATLDMKGVAAKLQELAEMISALQAQMPQDAGEEAALAVDEGAAEMEAQEAEAPAAPAEDDDKAARKMAAAKMLAKQLG